ncbi:MAG: sulfotransferase domain-containing protein [Aestuariivirga sp.]
MDVLPDRIPKSDEEMVEIFNAAMGQPPVFNTAYVYKVHGVMLADGFPNSRIITTIRDPRETVISFMRFMKTADFEQSLLTSKLLLLITKQYRDFKKTPVITLRYEDINLRPIEVVGKISDFIGANLDATAIREIASKLDRSSIKTKINQVEEKLEKKIASHQTVDPSEQVFIAEGNVRAFDISTGFQSGHVSDMTTDDYRRALTPQQVKKVNDVFGDWMDEHGYSREF